jgi:hypothetical protein
VTGPLAYAGHYAPPPRLSNVCPGLRAATALPRPATPLPRANSAGCRGRPCVARMRTRAEPNTGAFYGVLHSPFAGRPGCRAAR